MGGWWKGGGSEGWIEAEGLGVVIWVWVSAFTC